MPKKKSKVLYRSPLCCVLIAWLFMAFVYSGTVLGQVSESELNQLARDAASNRAASSLQSAPNNGIDFFTLLIKGGIFMIPIGVVSLMVVTFVFDRWIGLRSGRMLPASLRKSILQLTRQGDVDPRDVYRICGESTSAASKMASAATPPGPSRSAR